MGPSFDPEFRAPLRRLAVRIGATILVVGLVAIPGDALASEGWSQFQGDAAHTGTVDPGVQAPLKESWHLDVPLGGPGHELGLSAPVLAEDAVITVSPTSVIGVDLATGVQRWTVARAFGPSTPPAVAAIGGRAVLLYTEGFGSHPPGSTPTSTPSQTASVSVSPAGTPSGGSSTPAQGGAFDSRLVAIDLTTRKPFWDPVQLDRVSRTGVTIDGGTAFLGDNSGKIYAVDLATGHVRWTQKADGYVYTPLAASAGKVFATVQGGASGTASLVAMNQSDGSVAWRVAQRGENFVTAPAVGGGAVVAGFALVTSGGVSSTVVRAIDAASGVTRWSSTTGTIPTPIGAPAVTSDAVIAFDASGQAYRFDLRTGARVWDFALNERVFRTSPAVTAAQVFVPTSAGRLVALDAATGELVWQLPPSGDMLRDGLLTSGSLVLVRGGSHPGLVAFSHDPSGTLVRVASPTTVNLSLLLGGFVLAAVPLGVALVLGGRWLVARAGAPFPDPSDPDDPIDPYDADDQDDPEERDDLP